MHSSSPGRTQPEAARRAFPARAAQLLLGLFGLSVAITIFIRSEFGLGPWDAFHYGLHLQTGITVGVASITVGLAIVAISAACGVRPGIGTLLNMLLVGVFIDLLMPLVPVAPSLPLAAAYCGTAVVLAGLSSGMYMGAGFGQGPRDTLMVALVRRSGRSVRRIRTIIEVVVLLLGWSMGGTIGIGTVVITLTIGHSVQWGMRLFGAIPATSSPIQAAASAPTPAATSAPTPSPAAPVPAAVPPSV
jgi:uncharacterized protein